MITDNLNVIPDSRGSNIFSKALNIVFPLILISLNVTRRLLLYLMTSVFVGVHEKMLNMMP